MCSSGRWNGWACGVRAGRCGPGCRGAERNRLLDLGVVPGSDIGIDLVSPSGNPTAYRIRGASIALRREQADHVYVHITAGVEA